MGKDHFALLAFLVKLAHALCLASHVSMQRHAVMRSLLHVRMFRQCSQHSCRHNYEASAIASWLESHDTSPMTNDEMTSKVVAPNKSLKAVIDLLFPVC